MKPFPTEAKFKTQRTVAEAVASGDCKTIAFMLGIFTNEVTLDLLSAREAKGLTFITGYYVSPEQETKGLFAVDVQEPGLVTRAVAKVLGREPLSRIRTALY